MRDRSSSVFLDFLEYFYTTWTGFKQQTEESRDYLKSKYGTVMMPIVI